MPFPVFLVCAVLAGFFFFSFILIAALISVESWKFLGWNLYEIAVESRLVLGEVRFQRPLYLAVTSSHSPWHRNHWTGRGFLRLASQWMCVNGRCHGCCGKG